MSTLVIPESEFEAPHSSIRVNDVLFMLFRHKWKILFCATAGLLAAAAIYFLLPPVYESQAKLLVKYVLDRSAVDKLDSGAQAPGERSEDILNSEVEILNSTDLAAEVAEKVGVDRLLPGSGGKATKAAAARAISNGLDVTVVKGTNIISAIYKNENPHLVEEVLHELVNRYFDKHLEVHRTLGAFDFVTREVDQVRAQLNEAEEELKQLKAKAGITSFAEDTAGLANQLIKTQEYLDATEAELAAQKDRVDEIEKAIAGVNAQQSADEAAKPTSVVFEEYQALVARAAQLRQGETDLLARYTPQNRLVKVKEAQIDELEKQRRSLEKKYPLLASVKGLSEGQPPDLISERAKVVALETRAETLRSRLRALQERSKMFSELGPKLAQLERTKEVREENYKYYEASLEKARIDETLDPSRMPNISVVQTPSPVGKAKRDISKIVLGLAGGGLAAGIGLALLIELVFDRTLKRPIELEDRLRVPLLLSIPYLGSGGRRLRLHDAGHDSETVLEEGARSEAVQLENGNFLRPFCEAIRDRLGLYFEVNQMTHKPKLVAVTGLAKNAGASTLAAGLAATLTDTSDGKVLLVDKPVAPKRIYDMMAQFKASDLDYVVFDMPSLGEGSATLPLAGFMDKVLLVVEAEKSNGDAVKRAYSQLAAKTSVSVIFNKSRSYGLKWLEGEV
jgi:uncharacterized protein involved in exopolysaccharide biosynthesis